MGSHWVAKPAHVEITSNYLPTNTYENNFLDNAFWMFINYLNDLPFMGLFQFFVGLRADFRAKELNGTGDWEWVLLPRNGRRRQ